jgi:hypothetical protein
MKQEVKLILQKSSTAIWWIFLYMSVETRSKQLCVLYFQKENGSYIQGVF